MAPVKNLCSTVLSSIIALNIVKELGLQKPQQSVCSHLSSLVDYSAASD